MENKAGNKSNVVWWANPFYLIVFFIIPSFTYLYVNGFSPRYGKNYFNVEYFLLGLTFLCVLGFGSFVGSLRTSNRTINKISVKSNPRFLDLLAILTVMAYIIWFWKIITTPELIAEIIIGLSMNVRHEVSTIPGLTTLTQLGVVYVVLFSCYKWVWGIKIHKRYNVYFYIIILLALLRTIAWSERLATIEVLLPFLLIYLSFYRGKRMIQRVIIWCGPYLGVLFALMFFGIFEFFRSWGKQQANADSLISYMTDRFGYYYYSSMNNGAGLLTEFSWPQFEFQFTFNWIYAIPGVGPIITQIVSPSNDSEVFLEYYADTEFTTYSAIFPVFYDIGMFGGLIYAAIFGLVIGFCYRRFKEGIGLGLVIYPILFTSLTELLRILYLGESRVVPIVIFMIIGYKMIQDRNNPIVSVDE